ncbi:HDL120Wp [Eremothecium sinecaudum]|uniref:Enhancer of mRNA-decapping protein 3 n=1 Tax=Eremothecium sinecaudum TaxID=45286 RepID=A0A0X8HSF1_9SACH|nr:HDL120Wp [Eremothecium sinecaudum]AMD20624.1 HDL120Wp [Eremothecium sinecaudum]
MSQFQGFKVQVELRDGKLITGYISKCNSKSLTLQDVEFSDGGISQIFKVKSSRLRDLKVIGVPKTSKKWLCNNGNGSNITTTVETNGTNNNNDNSSRCSISSGNIDVNTEYSPTTGKSVTGNKQDSSWEYDEDLDKLKNEEFDFQSNLRMFNKQDVFAKLKQQEAVSPSERLVSHNRIKKPKSNFEHAEMVLPNAKNDDWDRTGTNTPAGSSASAPINGPAPTLASAPAPTLTPAPIPDYMPITKSINITHLLQQNKSTTTEEEMISKLQKVLSPASRSPSMSKVMGLRTLKSNLAVPLATPVQLLEMERLALDTFLFPPALSLEHSAIHLSKFIKKKLGGSIRLHNANNNAQPLIVIFASDNRCGARALAAGRCLAQNGHIRVISILTTETAMHSTITASVSDETVKVQLEMFLKFGGKIVDSIAGLKSMLDQLNSPVEIVIDAMQGFDCNVGDLIEDSMESESLQGTRIKNMIAWCNEQSCAVWSLETPTGIDAGSGLPNFDLNVQPSAIISTGWPLTSLNLLDCEELYLCDIGIPHQCYTLRNSLRKFHAAVDIFVGEGVVQLTR